MSSDYQLCLNGKCYAYDVRRSRRARYLQIKLSSSGVITLVIPKDILWQDAQIFLESKKSWLEKHIKRQPEKKPFHESRPESLLLPLVGEQWSLLYTYQPSLEKRETVDLAQQRNCLHLSGEVDDKVLVLSALEDWLKQKAKAILPQRLSKLAELHGFHYNRVTIRGQRTRWGSCSSQKNINLNYKLLFLEQSIVDYVLIHELCHTLEMNHSKRFWRLVAECDQHYRQHDQLLSAAGRTLPI